jgi:hypothetical protein
VPDKIKPSSAHQTLVWGVVGWAISTLLAAIKLSRQILHANVTKYEVVHPIA